MGPSAGHEHSEDAASAQRASAQRASACGSVPAVAAPGPGPAVPERVIALQRAAGNRAVARLLAEPSSRDDRLAPPAGAPARRPLQRSFFGTVWGGIKKAATAAWSGVSGAADWVWDGAKKLGGEFVDWLKSAGSAVTSAIRWIGDKAWEGIKAVGRATFEKLALLGSLAWDFVRFLPVRVWRVVIDGWDGISGLLSWLWKGITGKATWAEAWAAFKQWGVRTLVQCLELFGVGEALQFAWGLVFHTRPLTKAEREASQSVHPAGLIPYDEVRVDMNSWMVSLGQWINKLSDPTATKRPMTTMHIIQAASTLDLPTAVHELTHVAQYEKIGAVYMPQALHAQFSAMGYNYGDLTRARTDGKHFADFNREQQAQICEDYYQVTTGGTPDYAGTEASLAPFIADMRGGAF
jgi:hypothetical protein